MTLTIPTKYSTLLAIDTSGTACSVALSVQGEAMQVYDLEARQHTRQLLPLVDKILNKAHVEKSAVQGVVISAGPGAFTGLRIGATVAMGLATGWNVPLLPISSLALLAATIQRHSGAHKVLALMDARMDEVYAGLYEDGVCLGADRVCAPEALPVEWFGGALVAGAGTVYAARFPAPANLAEDDYIPEAIDAFSLLDSAVWQSPLQGVELHYLRNEVVHKHE
ncbi:MAG: tRNA (adenosine(37)-N6)-threonylcarbamoyltransferase complex dimerization subunit type 1 TsaB [Cardiobacteriaceae bacterium]|nr:tRNA (adenosine(37)-N6)-threonylcarbamoyltransferase complex dimerization subunit type 1 TsaB [Cardiobacteriaceae bacterium]